MAETGRTCDYCHGSYSINYVTNPPLTGLCDNCRKLAGRRPESKAPKKLSYAEQIRRGIISIYD